MCATSKKDSEKTGSGKGMHKVHAENIVREDTEHGNKVIVVDPEVGKDEYVEQALADQDILDALVNSLQGDDRRGRQFSATIIASIAHQNPECLVPSIDIICAAVSRPEAQTRWESFEALYELVPYCLSNCKKLIDAAETSLYDEESDLAVLAAFKFLCRLGEEDTDTSRKVWPLIDEAIQCYHGDIIFNDMLDELVLLAKGASAPKVKKELAARMAFDAKNGKGALKRRSQLIVDACNAK